MIRVLFVCLGNICRSPTAHGVLQQEITQRGWQYQVEVDSAGTAAGHAGKAPDSRSTAAAARRGCELSPLRARQVTAADLDSVDRVLAMEDGSILKREQ